jgi:hypothetical protein
MNDLSPDDYIRVTRSDLDSLVKCAVRLQAYAAFGRDGVATGTSTFLLEELRMLAIRPAMCAKCHADAEDLGLCGHHETEGRVEWHQGQRERDGDLEAMQGMF